MFLYWTRVNEGTTKLPSLDHLKTFYNIKGGMTWDRIPNSGFGEEFLRIGLIIMAGIVVGVSVYRGNRSRYLVVFGVSAATSILFVLSCMIFHHWYLFAPVMALIFFIFISDRKDYVLNLLSCILVVALLICNFPRIEQHYVHRLTITQELEDNWRESAVVERYLRDHGASGTILYNIFLALDAEKLEGVTAIWGDPVVLRLENGDESIIKDYEDPDWLYLMNKLDLGGYQIVLQTGCGFLYQKMS